MVACQASFCHMIFGTPLRAQEQTWPGNSGTGPVDQYISPPYYKTRLSMSRRARTLAIAHAASFASRLAV
ncbi:hypothetical protein A0H81_00690 [Grifola frondosa]|uniref:Uncharacterized protein n=1 Tax=Grifola frondosa TaxID=5627 RepID=A0A1C7MS89_GRIFR|nr:hypothetical protein A0H81_00690 [Grifola frondosa]